MAYNVAHNTYKLRNVQSKTFKRSVFEMLKGYYHQGFALQNHEDCSLNPFSQHPNQICCKAKLKNNITNETQSKGWDPLM